MAEALTTRVLSIRAAAVAAMVNTCCARTKKQARNVGFARITNSIPFWPLYKYAIIAPRDSILVI